MITVTLSSIDVTGGASKQSDNDGIGTTSVTGWDHGSNWLYQRQCWRVASRKRSRAHSQYFECAHNQTGFEQSLMSPIRWGNPCDFALFRSSMSEWLIVVTILPKRQVHFDIFFSTDRS
jgi:hypothetical protein